VPVNTVCQSLGTDRTQMDLQMRSATMIRFFEMMLRPGSCPQVEQSVSVDLCSNSRQLYRSLAARSACSKLRWIMWQLPAYYRFPAVNHRTSPPVALHVRVSDWSNLLYTYTKHQTYVHRLIIGNFSNPQNMRHIFQFA
jgi:hypothetical protein